MEQAQLNAMAAELERDLAKRPERRFGFWSGGSLLGILFHRFMHSSWSHLIGNMWLLVLIGFKIEDLWGHWVFSALYLAGGLVAANPQASIASFDVPMVGASGAIAALMGAFLLRLYTKPDNTLNKLMLRFIPLPSGLVFVSTVQDRV